MDTILYNKLNQLYHNDLKKLTEVEVSQLSKIVNSGVKITGIKVQIRNKTYFLNELRIEEGTFPINISFPFLRKLIYRNGVIPKTGFFFPKLNELELVNTTVLPDLSYFFNNYKHEILVKLRLSDCGLETLPDLSGVKALWHLDLAYNKFTSLDGFERLKSCANLQEIFLINNEITDLCEFEPLSHLSRLNDVNLGYNRLKHLNITHNVPKLNQLILNNNQINQIVAVRNLPELRYLGLSKNKIESLNFKNFGNLPKFREINVRENPIQSITGIETLNKFDFSKIFIYNGDFDFSEAQLKEFINYLKSIGWGYEWKISSSVIYKTPPPQAEVIINQYLTLRLERWGSEGKGKLEVNLYVVGDVFNQCTALLINIPKNEVHTIENINSIDEAGELFSDSQAIDNENGLVVDIPIKTQFWGHASNLQAWVENDYDTRLLHRNIAFPLLKKLTEIGDPMAKRVFKEEIAKRYASGHPAVVEFLKIEGYLKLLSSEELASIE